jgi:triacylglycerol lipase
VSFLTKLPRERFSKTAFDDFAGGPDFNLGDAKAQAWMSQLAYETDEPDKIQDVLSSWGLALVDGGVVVEEVATVLPQPSTCCFVAAGRGMTFMAFAGTDPLVLANWITNFDAHITTSGAAHGYETAAAAVWPRLKLLLAKPAAAGHKIVITGHSLGGALAALTAHKVETDGAGSTQAVYTFGMPRPGNPDFAAAYDTLLGRRTYRLVHGEDLVPTVAPSSLGFRHLGRFLHCDRRGKFDASRLASDTSSDEPAFVSGVSKELTAILQGPLSNLLSPLDRLKLATALAVGIGPSDMRTDPGGILIELLPPRLRDHIPDRYIAAVS